MSNPISKSDKAFLRQFSMVIVVLSVIALLLIVLAVYIYGHQPAQPMPGAAEAVQQRVEPVGQTYAGDTGRAALAAEQAAEKASAPQAAYGGTTDGKAIYGHLCHTCHTPGIAGAPKLGDKAQWAPRIAQGVDTLIKHATDGYKGPDGFQMPAKGGNPALTDTQITNTVKWMVAQVK